MADIYSDYVVQRVNELYHDFLGQKYDHSHPEIFQRLPPRWMRIARQHLSSDKPLVILDLGTGTGFVPLTIGSLLKKKDTFICSDLSQNLLQVAQENIGRQPFSARFQYVKVAAQAPYRLPFKDESMDVITINSMLHHVQDTSTFLNEVDRVLKPGGKVFIAHEPHYYFHAHWLLASQAAVWRLFLCPRQVIARMARKAGLMPLLEYGYYRLIRSKVNNRFITEKVNAVLLQEKLIITPIAPSEIKKITDIRLEGFRPEQILPAYSLLLFETYNHLGDDIAKKYRNTFILAYERLLERKFPRQGNQFFVIKQKPELP